MNNLSGSLSFHGDVSGQMGANLIPSVEANPSGTATEILTSIRVGDIIYSIPSGGSGDYDDLSDKPQINGVTLEGNCSSDDLQLQDKINFTEDSTQFLDGTGTFRSPDYFSGDYDDLTDKPQINGVTLEGDKSSSDLHLISEVHDVGPAAEVNFEADDTLPLLSCITDIVATQSGSGTPSPSNIRPISGHSSVTVTVASTSGGSGEDTTVTLGRTVYKGTLDLNTGKLRVTHGFNTYTGDASENWIYTSSLNRVYINIADAIRPSNYTEIQSNILHYSLPQENYGSYINNQGNLIVYAPTTITNASDWKTWLVSNNIQLVYELATPQTFTLTKEQIQTLPGQNYVRCDTGDIQVTYATDIVDPLLKWLLENR